MARFTVHHQTRYEYAATVTLSQKLLHLTPRTFQFQTCAEHRIEVDPAPDEAHASVDYFGNPTRYLALTSAHESLIVAAHSTVDLLPRPGLELLERSLPWEQVRDRLRQFGDPTRLEPLRYLYTSPHVVLSEALGAYASRSFGPGRSVLDGAWDLTRRIQREFIFDPKATDISTPLDDVMKLGRGVCQDFAHLMIGCLRTLGLSCRYVSGYLLTKPAPGMPRLIGADASHAWVSVYCPSIGWVDFDPTNGCMVNLEHITLGWGRDFSDVTPLRGVLLGGGAQRLKVEVTVTPVAATVSR